MYRQVCSITMRDRLAAGKPVSKDHLPSNWMAPISYKQFSNMLQKKNKVYEDIVARNGSADPLHKTLLIIDEAHKLYAPSTSPAERPDTRVMESWIQKSYAYSGTDSVRILAMTATPYTESGMEMIRLLNLLRPAADALPADFDLFAAAYLNAATGEFTAKGRRAFANAVAGYISYLNRSSDARNFAYPVIHDVVVPLTTVSPEPFVKENRFKRRMADAKAVAEPAKAAVKVQLRECKTTAANTASAAVLLQMVTRGQAAEMLFEGVATGTGQLDCLHHRDATVLSGKFHDLH
jgi:superfamily II DNA or RNA helicase